MNVDKVSVNYLSKKNSLTTQDNLKRVLPVLNTLEADVFERSNGAKQVTSSAANVSFNGSVGFLVGALTPIISLLYFLVNDGKYKVKK